MKDASPGSDETEFLLARQSLGGWRAGQRMLTGLLQAGLMGNKRDVACEKWHRQINSNSGLAIRHSGWQI